MQVIQRWSGQLDKMREEMTRYIRVLFMKINKGVIYGQYLCQYLRNMKGWTTYSEGFLPKKTYSEGDGSGLNNNI